MRADCWGESQLFQRDVRRCSLHNVVAVVGIDAPSIAIGVAPNVNADDRDLVDGVVDEIGV